MPPTRSAPPRFSGPAIVLCLFLTLLPLLFLFTVFVPAAFPSGSQQNLPLPGFRSLGVWDPNTSFRMDIAVWYPTTRASRDLNLEGWMLHSGKDGAAIPGKYPVILLSHDAAASRLASHDLAAHLSRHGFIVISPSHPGDNVDGTDFFFRAQNFASRPRHLITAYNEVRKSPVLGPVMDTSRIGLLGVGSGAATVLQLAGAAPDLSRLDGYCPDGPLLDPLCSAWAKTFHPRMKREFANLAGRPGPDMFTPYIERPPIPDTADLPKINAAPGESEGAQPGSSPETPPLVEADARSSSPSQTGGPPVGMRQPILAVGLLTPGQIGLFPDEALRGFFIPTGILSGADDAVYPPAANAARLLDLLPQRPVSRAIKGVNHHDLQPPCPPMYQEGFAAMCGRTGEGAAEAREIRNDFFALFFCTYLGNPLPAPPALPAQPAPAR